MKTEKIYRIRYDVKIVLIFFLFLTLKYYLDYFFECPGIYPKIFFIQGKNNLYLKKNSQNNGKSGNELDY